MPQAKGRFATPGAEVRRLQPGLTNEPVEDRLFSSPEQILENLQTAFDFSKDPSGRPVTLGERFEAFGNQSGIVSVAEILADVIGAIGLGGPLTGGAAAKNFANTIRGRRKDLKAAGLQTEDTAEIPIDMFNPIATVPRLRAALRIKETGRIIGSPDNLHFGAFQRLEDPDVIKTIGGGVEEGFIDSSGRFLNRGQVQKMFGGPTSEENANIMSQFEDIFASSNDVIPLPFPDENAFDAGTRTLTGFPDTGPIGGFGFRGSGEASAIGNDQLSKMVLSGLPGRIGSEPLSQAQKTIAREAFRRGFSAEDVGSMVEHVSIPARFKKPGASGVSQSEATEFVDGILRGSKFKPKNPEIPIGALPGSTAEARTRNLTRAELDANTDVLAQNIQALGFDVQFNRPGFDVNDFGISDFTPARQIDPALRENVEILARPVQRREIILGERAMARERNATRERRRPQAVAAREAAVQTERQALSRDRANFTSFGQTLSEGPERSETTMLRDIFERLDTPFQDATLAERTVVGNALQEFSAEELKLLSQQLTADEFAGVLTPARTTMLATTNPFKQTIRAAPNQFSRELGDSIPLSEQDRRELGERLQQIGDSEFLPAGLRSERQLLRDELTSRGELGHRLAPAPVPTDDDIAQAVRRNRPEDQALTRERANRDARVQSRIDELDSLLGELEPPSLPTRDPSAPFNRTTLFPEGLRQADLAGRSDAELTTLMANPNIPFSGAGFDEVGVREVFLELANRSNDPRAAQQAEAGIEGLNTLNLRLSRATDQQLTDLAGRGGTDELVQAAIRRVQIERGRSR